MTKRKAQTLASEVESLLRTSASDMDSLDLLPRDVASRRTDDLLRNMLGTPPDPRVSPKPAKPAPKKPRKK